MENIMAEIEAIKELVSDPEVSFPLIERNSSYEYQLQAMNILTLIEIYGNNPEFSVNIIARALEVMDHRQ